MKRIISIVILCVGIVAASAQQPKPETKTLSLDASKMIDAIEADKKACIDAAAQKEALILLGANVPRDAQCNRGADGLWICVKPEVAKASPSPK